MLSVQEFLASQGIESSGDTTPKVDYNISKEAGYLKDADTYGLPDNQAVRLKGVNALEVPGWDSEKQLFKPGQFGGELQQELTQKVIQEQGFTKPVYDPNIKDETKTRFLGDLKNEKGELVTNYLLAHGLTDLTRYSTPDQIATTTVGRMDYARRKELEAANRFELAKEGKYKYMDTGDLYHDMLVQETNKIPLMAKPFALTAKQYGANPDEYTGAAYIRPEENEIGQARSNLKTGLKSGWLSVKQGLYGSANLLSTQMDYEPGKTYSDAHLNRLKDELDDLPFLKNAEAFDSKTGKWKLDTYGKFFDYVTATAAQSAPQMVASIAAAIASPLTYGASLSVPAAIYTGQIWNDQPAGKKDAAWALSMGITSAALDNLGIKGIAGSLSNKATRELAVEALVKKGISREVAEQQIIAESKKVTKQLMEFTKAASEGVVSEGSTEVLQELAQVAGTNLGEIKDSPELRNRLLNAGFGGAVLGGGISGAGHVATQMFTSPDNTKQQSDLKFREETRNKQGYIPNVRDVFQETVSSNGLLNTLENQSQPEESKRQTAGLPATVANWWKDKGLSSLVGKNSNTIVGDRGHRGPLLASIATFLGANNAVNGGDIYSIQETTSGSIINQLGNIKDIQNKFGGKKLEEISQLLYKPEVLEYMSELARYKKSAKDANMDEAVKNVTDNLSEEMKPFKEGIIEAANRIDDTIKMFNDKTQSKKTFDDVVAARSVNKSFVSRNRERFLKDIKSALNLNDKQALEYYSAIVNNENNFSMEDVIEDAFDINNVKGNTVQSLVSDLHKANANGILTKYFNNNIFDNMNALAHRGGALHVNKFYIGKNGEILASVLDRAVKEKEVSVEEASFMAKEIKDFLAMRDGTYHEIKNPLVNGVIDTITFFSTLASLPLATISSIPEAAQVMRGLNVSQTRKVYKRLLVNTAEEMGAVLQELGQRKKVGGPDSRTELASYGYVTGDQNVAARHDIHSGYFQEYTNGFFKLIGLQGYTNATRYARLSIAADAIKNWMDTILDADMTKLSQSEQDAYEHLIRLGIDPFFFNNPEVTRQDYNDMMMRGTYNFINEAVVHPNILNRPKFYSDPYFKLFTMFQGYISTFTANVLPRLYGDLAKKGSADQRNALATVATMLALTALAMMIKDMIKYGETPPKWLKGDDAKLMQRFVGATGLTGTGERVINFVNPLVEKKATNAFEKMYNILEGESPTISFGAKMANAANAVLGDGSKPIKKVAGISPIIGPVNQLGDYLQDKLGGQ